MSEVVGNVEAERAAVAESLIAVGPSARTACADGTAFDLAAHLAEERLAGVLTFAIRSLGLRGVSLPSRPRLADSVIRREPVVDGLPIWDIRARCDPR